jgi:hypothetical protein
MLISLAAWAQKNNFTYQQAADMARHSLKSVVVKKRTMRSSYFIDDSVRVVSKPTPGKPTLYEKAKETHEAVGG